jgi:hypothetical protein
MRPAGNLMKSFGLSRPARASASSAHSGEGDLTRKDVAQLKGELFGLQVLVMQSLCFIAAHTEDPVRHLNGIRDSAVAGISGELNMDVPPRYLEIFQEAAADLVFQCVAAAQGVLAKDGILPTDPSKASDEM